MSLMPFDSLVKERHFGIDNKTLFITISPNPSTFVDCVLKNKMGKIRNQKRPYGMLKQDIQYQYCLKCLREDYFEWFSDDVELIGIAELNQRGNVHFHIVVNDPYITNEVQLQVFRRDILNGFRTQQNISKGKVSGKDWMNNIVYVNVIEDEITEYFMKQQHEMLPKFQNIYL